MSHRLLLICFSWLGLCELIYCKYYELLTLQRKRTSCSLVCHFLCVTSKRSWPLACDFGTPSFTCSGPASWCANSRTPRSLVVLLARHVSASDLKWPLSAPEKVNTPACWRSSVSRHSKRAVSSCWPRLGPFLMSASRNRWIAVVTDYVTQFAIAHALPASCVTEFSDLLLHNVILTSNTGHLGSY